MAKILNFDNLAPAPAYDYRSPFMRASIIRPDGQIYPLWTDIGLTPLQKESLGLQLNSLAFLQELTVELQPAYLPIMKARLVFPYREGIIFLNSKLVEWGYSTLEVIFGYVGGSPSQKILSAPYRGTLLQPEIETSAQQITVTLNAQGVGGFAAAGTSRIGTFTATRRELLEHHFCKGPDPALKRDLKIDFRRVDHSAIPDTLAKEELNRSITVSPSGRTDWEMIMDLIRDSNCWFYLEGNTIIVYPKSTLAAPPSRVFRHMDYEKGSLSSSNRVYPIFKFSSEVPAVYLPAETIGYWSSDIKDGNPAELIKKVVSHEPVPNTTNSAAPTTTGKGAIGPAATNKTPVVNDTTKDGLGFFVGSPEVPKWVNQMEENLRNASRYIGMSATIDTIGLPDITPMETIAVRGFGSRIDGDNFGILKVRHTLGTGGFLTS